MAACNCDGFVLPACEFIKETMDTERCIQYVEEALVKSKVLGNYVRGERNSIVVMDNVAQHHHPLIRQLIEGAGAELLFLPRYSPDLSPIELGFSVFKQNLQQIGLARRSDQEFESVVFQALAGWQVSAARNSFRHCGFKVDTVEEEEVRDRRRTYAVLVVVLHTVASDDM